MKGSHWIGSILLVLLCVCMTGCGKGNELMHGAAAEKSGLSVYYYDGEDTVRGYLFDLAEKKEVLNTLSAVNARPISDWSPADLKAPIYSVSILKEDGRPLSAVWAHGIWITQDGKAYRFDYDFEKLWVEHDWQAINTWEGQLVSPCQHALTYCVGDREEGHDGGGVSAWDPTWMTPAQEVTASEGKEIQLLEWTDTSVRVKLINHSGQEWIFGEYYHLEVDLNGAWYHVPTAPGENWVVHDIAYMLPDGGEKEMTYSLVCYGELPAGHYRLVAEAFEEGLAVETDVKFSQNQ